MYTQIWLKYLPIIRILLKRTKQESQVLDLNRIDFERMGTGRKAGYKFNIEFTKGRVSNLISSSPLASDLAAVMLDDKTTKEFLDLGEYTVSLNTKFQLLIKGASTETLNATPETEE
jgi:hypothetical protein